MTQVACHSSIIAVLCNSVKMYCFCQVLKWEEINSSERIFSSFLTLSDFSGQYVVRLPLFQPLNVFDVSSILFIALCS